MEDLKKQRATLKGKLTLFVNYIKDINERVVAGEQLTKMDLANIQKRLTATEPLLDRFENIVTQLLTVDGDGDDDAQVELGDFSTKYFDSISIAECLLDKDVREDTETKQTNNEIVSIAEPSRSLSDSVSIRANSLENSIKLPTIQLPKFSGNSEEWLEFRDLFISLINENDSLDSVIKFHYLRASLEGDAAQIIKAIDFCAENYNLAWVTINERYNSVKVLVHNHVKSLFQLEHITRESSSKLRNLLDAVSKHMRSIKSLTSEKALGETLIIYLITSKLDGITAREWEEHISGNDLPTLEDLKFFLKSRADLLETLESKQSQHQKQDRGSNNKSNKSSKSFVATSANNCPLCNKNHAIWSCDKFQALALSERLDKAKALKLCLLCLKKGHFIGNCKSKYNCSKCKKRHNILLHNESLDTALLCQAAQTVASVSSGASQVLLSTASVRVLDPVRNKWITARVLVDCGSQSNFITTDLCKALGLETNNVNMTVLGISHSPNKIRSKCEIQIRSHNNQFTLKTSCLVIDQITGTLPNFKINISNLKIPKDIKLADPSFGKPQNIDILLGAEHFYHLLCVGQISLGQNMPMLQKSRFGWLVSGPILSNYLAEVHCNLGKVHDIQSQLSKFWEIEEGTQTRSLSLEERTCEAHYFNNTKRDPEGRFIVSLPLKDSPEKIGESRKQAEKRFLALERRLQSNKILRDRYCKFMLEFKNLNHMSLVTPKPGEIEFYLPHHGVLKEESVSTKLRVVFDGSARSTSGYSLNDIQMVGPNIQQDLFAILLRFRKGKYAISADIEKMYRQVQINPKQRSLQRILWRSNNCEQIQAYNLNTVTYGTASASFLAIRSLYQIGLDVETSHPYIAKIIKSDFYVDDLLTSVDTCELAKHICKTLPTVLATGCFRIHKWISNEPQLLLGINAEDVHPNILNFGEHENTKTLGLTWCSMADELKYSITNVTCPRVTKRAILSEIAQIFDPLGLLSPCTIVAKCIIQDLWREKLDWDESIPSVLHDKWLKFRNQLPLLNNLRINRRVICSNYKTIELHGFSDASNQAYGACIFIRSIDENNKVFVNLLCAKSKVAPVKQTTIPRLELCGALTLSRLSEKICKYFDVEINSCIFWCDSSIVLGWLQTSPNLLKTFVCNRVVEIQEITQHGHWRHVPTQSNPADLLTRGMSPADVHNSQLWWNGPAWLHEDCSQWPSPRFNSSALPEMKSEKTVLLSSVSAVGLDFAKYSNLSYLERVVAYCFRFRYNCMNSKSERRTGPLNVKEINHAHFCLVKVAQAESYKIELQQLKQQRVLSNAQIQSLNPFIDKDGLIRVGGRIRNADFNFNKRHPILLNGRHRLTKLIFVREHLRLLHAGPQCLLASIRERYWPVAGRNVARQTVHQCLSCFRAAPKTITPLMGDLPQSRVQPAPPFYNTGVDYAGPLMIKDRKGRGSKRIKCYICIFICFITKAIHLELVTDLSTESFILTLRRFVSRRGKPNKIYSDNGTAFVGAQSKLRELGNFLKGNKSCITEFMTSQEIDWHFIPPRAPHFGGLWEAGVKSCKHHLKRIVGNALLTYEEMHSLLVQIEAVLNSRPLYPLSPDPNDFNPLTPAHFLIGRSLTSVPDPSLLQIPESRLSHYQRVQQLHQHFWKRWSKEYIAELQQRSKWRAQNGDLLEGAMVLVKDDNLPPSYWKLGRVIQVHPGKDLVNRVATIQTLNGTIKRAFSKICPLPLDETLFQRTSA